MMGARMIDAMTIITKRMATKPMAAKRSAGSGRGRLLFRFFSADLPLSMETTVGPGQALKVLAILASLFSAAFVSGCASTQTPSGGVDVNDPWESTNRKLFAVDRSLDKAIIKPIAKGYRKVVPHRGRKSIRNFVENLHSPVTLANDILQLEPKRASITLSRLVINSTIGLVGFFDPAKKMGLPRHKEDFGQTLAVYGVPEGPYIYIPVLGPLPPREIIGFGVDIITNPLVWMGDDAAGYVNKGRVAAQGLGDRERNIEVLENLEETSLDFYASLRNLYRQNRANEIRNGVPEFEDLPDFEDEFEDDF